MESQILETSRSIEELDVQLKIPMFNCSDFTFCEAHGSSCGFTTISGFAHMGIHRDGHTSRLHMTCGLLEIIVIDHLQFIGLKY